MAVPFSNTKLRPPRGLRNILEGLSREVLRCQPNDVYAFATLYLDKLLQIRKESGWDPAEIGDELEDRFYNKIFKTFNIRFTEQDLAAIKIQTKYRQYRAKLAVLGMRQERAAIKIQAGYRGYLARKQIRSMEDDVLSQAERARLEAQAEDDAYYDAEGDRPARMPPQDRPDDPNEEPVGPGLDLDDPNVIEAALRIQGGIRGYLHRQSGTFSDRDLYRVQYRVTLDVEESETDLGPEGEDDEARLTMQERVSTQEERPSMQGRASTQERASVQERPSMQQRQSTQERPSAVQERQSTAQGRESSVTADQERQSVAAGQRLSAQDRQSVQEPRESVQERKSVQEPRQSTQEPRESVQERKSVQEPRQSTQEPRESVQERQSVQEPRQSTQEPRQSVQDPQSVAAAADRQSVAPDQGGERASMQGRQSAVQERGSVAAGDAVTEGGTDQPPE